MRTAFALVLALACVSGCASRGSGSKGGTTIQAAPHPDTNDLPTAPSQSR